MGYIYGKVTDATQKNPICNATIWLYGGNVDAAVTTDWVGNFTFMNYPEDIPAGQYQISFGSPNDSYSYPYSEFSGTVELPASGNAEYNVALSSNSQQPFTVAGFLGTLGGPVPAGATIKFVGANGETQAQPDSSGLFAVNLPQGQYTLSCVGEGYAPTSVSGLVLPEDVIVVGWVLDFLPLETLTGTVVDEN